VFEHLCVRECVEKNVWHQEMSVSTAFLDLPIHGFDSELPLPLPALPVYVPLFLLGSAIYSLLSLPLPLPPSLSLSYHHLNLNQSLYLSLLSQHRQHARQEEEEEEAQG